MNNLEAVKTFTACFIWSNSRAPAIALAVQLPN
jgi:hypothetical protein